MTEERKAQLKEEQRERGLKYGKKNLIPWSKQPREVSQAGAKASNEAQRKKREIKAIYNDLLSMDALELTQDGTVSDIAERLQKAGNSTDAYTVINAVQVIKAMQGSTKSAEFVRDTAGDKPDNRLSIEADITTDSDRELMQSLSNRIESLEAIETNAKPLE